MELCTQTPRPDAVPYPSFPEKTDERKIRVLFVCTGNTCRSPMAAAWLNRFGAAHGIEAVSAGLFPSVGAPISQNAVAALKAAGVTPGPDNRYDLHTARRVDEAAMLSCDRAIGITRAHAMQLICDYPAFAGKISSMPRDIPDPFGGAEEDYALCLDRIASCLKEMFLLDV